MNRTSLAIVGVAWVTALSCAGSASKSMTEPGPNPARTSFFNQGKEVIFGADLRAARITGPDEFLPVQVVLLNRTQKTIALDRESFTLVRPDGANLPMASPEEFWRDYPRAKADLRMGVPFLEEILARYPEPPFHWNDASSERAGPGARPQVNAGVPGFRDNALDFFPEKFSGRVPRERMELRFGEGTYGYLYFRQPGTLAPVPSGAYKLLLKPQRDDVTYVLDFFPYRTKHR